LNEKISNFWISHAHLHDKLRLIHQTGSRDFENIKNKYAGLTGYSREHLEVYEFIYDMPAYYRRADVQFCRGGASTIAEASAFGVLPLVVPLPAADNHQQKNAEILEQKNAGFVFSQEGFKTEDFAATILKLLENPALRAEMAENLKKLAPEQAAREIAHDILKQI
jgi:UDP-N-acetylglucosamine--N-acetylmuramyl-(pentapeptide) pyrophosphoryl-undecaprenol N-acetylglucosamine transferase